jgi:long-subunit acyl-CoA synthetase (AMP-forming)
LAGLLLVRGPGVATSYHHRPLETAETFLAGGWCNTGDIAELVLAPEGVLSACEEDGRLVFAGANQKSVYLRLIEKESNREKLLNAEFVTFDEVQRRFKQREGCQIIAYVAPVIEDRPFVGALFFINLPVAIALLQEHGVVLPEEDKLYAFCAQHGLVHEAVWKAVNATNEEVKEPFKRVSSFAIVSQEPSNINGWLSIKNEISVRRVRKECPALIGKIYGPHICKAD